MAVIGAKLNLTPTDAVKYLQDKGMHMSWDWHETSGAAHSQSFTVAKVTTADVLQAIHGEVERATKDGIAFEQFAKTLRPRLQDLGWWGKKEVLDGDTGELTKVQLGSMRRLRTIFHSNVQTAYMAGRYKRFVDNVQMRPYWRYVAILDGRTRPHHRALHGKVWRWDDPIWQVIWPPNGWGCRCRVEALSEKEFQALGIPLEDGTGSISVVDVPVNKEGKTVPVKEVRYTDELGRPQVFRPDPTWDFNPGADYARRNTIVKTLADKVDRLPVQIGAKVAASVTASPLGTALIDSAWQGWVNEVLADPITRKRTGVLGFLQPAQLAYLAEKGIEVLNAAIKVEDSRIIGKKAVRHGLAGNALAPADWAGLSEAIRTPLAVLFDVQNQTLLYVLASDGASAQRIVVAPVFTVKGDASGSLRTAYWSKLDDLIAEVKGGNLQLLEGVLE